jgi:TonB family protein
VVVPQSKPLRSSILSALERSSSDSTDSGLSRGAGSLDLNTAVSSLKDLIAAGDHRLDPMLATITDAARQLTGASGAALAMWKEGEMVCRARSGETAPALGARLSADTGISGECLRTGKIQHCPDTENNPLVDAEVCRSLGLRSIVVLPIQGWRGINGILEIFATQPSSFSEEHILLLQQLAALAERARASQPHGASPAVPKPASAISKPQPSGLLPASDRVGDVALAFVDRKSRPFVLGGIALLAISLIALVIWLGLREPDDGTGKAHAAAPLAAPFNSASSSAMTAQVVMAARPHDAAHPPDNDPVWKKNPGGEALYVSVGKPTAGTPVQFASKVDVVSQRKSAQSPLLGDVVDKVAADVAVPHPATDTQPEEAVSSEPPSISGDSAKQSDLNGVLIAKASMPGLSLPVSRGVSGGHLVRRVPPVYPPQAKMLRLEGSVVLTATVREDGSVHDVKVVKGAPEFAPSAVEAVKQWRYRPFQLDGKPVSTTLQINVDFKLPSSTASR